ncbi:leishmanolysin-related zinc metalloendopeptidase [Reyranella sp.]|uniref:leishmanolysin-related zinc metalloendopeptidase n=1 Tax=Reyranella sp. TaxID=1929291 RepID=UPI003BA92069
MIEADGSTTLVEVDNNYRLGTSGPILTIDGAPVVAGANGPWTPIGVEATATGFEVAWEATGYNQYTVWATNSAGAYVSTMVGPVPGGNAALQALETSFQQDLNGDGTTGLVTTTIEADGATDLVQIGDHFYLGALGPQLSIGGAAVVAGANSPWTPVAVEQTASGFEVAWEATGYNQYIVWATNSSGAYVSTMLGPVAGGNAALQALETSFQQDLNGDGTTGLVTTTIEADGATDLVQIGDHFYLGALGPQLSIGGAAVVAGANSPWTPVAVEQTASGFEVAWEATGYNQYIVWATNSAGAYVSTMVGPVAGGNAALQALETSFQQDLNGDGTTGLVTTAIETDGATDLVQIGDHFYLGALGPQLSIGGAAVVAGANSPWTPVAVEATATGFEVAWEATGYNQYIVWATNSAGAYVSTMVGPVPGGNAALQALETSFQQDLNGDGTTGLVTTAIETDGATDLVQIGDHFYLGVSGPQLSIGGAAVVAGANSPWTPVAVEQTASGFEVAWEATGYNQYIVWATNSSGAYMSTMLGPVAGTSAALRLLESSFEQDLNGDGVTGLPTTVIESSGSTSLLQVGDYYYLGASGPQLSIGGTAVMAGANGPWTPFAAEQTVTGFDVAWKATGYDLYQVWATNSGGAYVSTLVGQVVGGGFALKALEPTFQQDLNGDGVTGFASNTVIENVGATSLVRIDGEYFLDGASGVQLKFSGAAVTEGQFAGWSPVGAEATGNGGYRVVWSNDGGDQFRIWTVDGAGNYQSGNVAVAGTSYALESLEPAFQQDFNGDGTTGLVSTTIESVGAGRLTLVGDTYFVGFNSTDVMLKFAGVPVTVGRFPDWTPAGTEPVPGGFRVIWKHAGTDEYKVWETDGSGNYVSGDSVLAGTSYAFQTKEGTLGQDINGDGAIGLKSTLIESAGLVKLYRLADTYALNGIATILKFNGTHVTADTFAGWSAIGAEVNGSGFLVAWKNASGDQFKIWNVDFNGNYVSGNVAVSGFTYDFESQETVFEQDLNGDGTIGINTAVIESSGDTTLVRIADTFTVDGKAVKLNGATFAQTDAWTPIGAEAVAGGGYQLVLKFGSTDQYKFWNLDSAANFVSGGATMLGINSTLQSTETAFQQDLNGDGTTGIDTTVIESSGAATLVRIADTFTVDGKAVMLNGTAFVQSDAWTPIGADATAGIYQLAMKFGSTDQYVVWNLDSNGNFLAASSVMNGIAFGAEYYEHVFQQDLNNDGLAPASTVIESTGLTTLVRIGSGYFLNPSSGGSGPQLHAGDTILGFAGGAGNWVPVAAEEWAEGIDVYDVVFNRVGSNLYREEIARFGADMAPFFGGGEAYAASSPDVEDMESDVLQDLNGDGVIGPTSVTVESSGSSTLYRSTLTNTYHLGSRDGLELKIDGVAVTGDDLWKPIAAEYIAGLYKVVLRAGNLDEYQVGRTDGAGNFIASALGILSANSIELKIWETFFKQNVNGDSVIGIPDGVIEANGSGTLVKQGDDFYAYQTGSSTGVLLKSNSGGQVVTSPLLPNTYVPIAVDWTSEYGFQVMSMFTDSNVYRVDDVDSAGRFTVQTIGTLQSDSILLKAAEGVFHQDFNRDGTAGLPSTGAFDIDIHFHGDQGYRLYFEAAAQRWEQIITSDLPDTESVTAAYGTIDDVRIDVTVDAIDGRNGVLASADWDELGDGWMPVHGNISIDSGDLSFMRSDNRLLSVAIHEIGHVLGIGSLWSLFGLTDTNGYVGEYGLEAYRQLSGNASATFVPLETTGGDGTAGGHWSESIFGNERMTGFLSGAVNPLSILTIGALQDLGYTVDYTKADAYTLTA